MRFKTVVSILMLAGFALAEDWKVDTQQENSVTFISSTPLLDFEGKTNNIDGYIYWEGEKPFGDKNEVYFEVQLSTFNTGNGKRDRDMREDVLETETYPVATFTGTFADVSHKDGVYNVQVNGKMNLHGHEKELKIPGKITRTKDSMHVKCDFSIYLKDYQIEAPALVAFIKVAEEIKLQLDFKMIPNTDAK